MPAWLTRRFLVEAGFLLLVALAVGIAELDPWWLIVVVMTVAWLGVAAVEWSASRQAARAGGRGATEEAADTGTTGGEAEGDWAQVRERLLAAAGISGEERAETRPEAAAPEDGMAVDDGTPTSAEALDPELAGPAREDPSPSSEPQAASQPPAAVAPTEPEPAPAEPAPSEYPAEAADEPASRDQPRVVTEPPATPAEPPAVPLGTGEPPPVPASGSERPQPVDVAPAPAADIPGSAGDGAAAVEPARRPDSLIAPTGPQQWNLWQLERLARDRAGEDPVRDEEWSFLFMHLREFAGPDGALPADFDGLVRDAFHDLIDAGAPADSGA